MNEFDRMVEFLDSAYVLKDQLVPCLVGPVGIGKTAAVQQHAKNVGANKVVEIIASQILPNEVSGITMPDSDTKAMEIYDHFRLSSLEDGDILFFDELLEADQMVLSACLTLIESRTMMSGKKLPDIQIIAATNPTIQPNMLKENIRQRFMFAKFNIDRAATKQFIKDDCGFVVPERILAKLEETGSEYNILSPRSLTKLCRWIVNTPDNKRSDLASVINNIWNSSIGSDLVKCYNEYQDNPERKAKRAIKDVVDSLNITVNEEEFNDSSLEELMETLQSLPEWSSIKEVLETMSVYDEEENVTEEIMEF